MIRVTTEAFYLRNGFMIPEPPDNLPGNPSQISYFLTPRGLKWAPHTEPLPDDVKGYMNILLSLVPNLDPIIRQYIEEGLNSFDRQGYFAATVMVGAAAEKAVYLLADSVLVAFSDTMQRETLKKVMERRNEGPI